MLTRRELLKFSGGRTTTDNGCWLHLSRQAMACRFEATLPSCDQSGVNLARNALAEIDGVEQQLTIFRDTSEISYINRIAATRPVRVKESLFALLILCQELSGETKGAFDITSGPLSDCWGFLRRQGRKPEPHEIEAARELVGTDLLLLDRKSHAIRFQRTGVQINLGGIGKGYALDRVAATIEKRVRTCLLTAGSSSIRAIGNGGRDSAGWIIGVRHPRDKNRRLAVLRMRDCAMATSGSEEQYFEVEGERYGHIIDSRSGMPAKKVSSVTVITRSAAVADALATAFFVGGPELAESYCSTHSGVVAIMLESGSGHAIVFGSNNLCEVEIK